MKQLTKSLIGVTVFVLVLAVVAGSALAQQRAGRGRADTSQVTGKGSACPRGGGLSGEGPGGFGPGGPGPHMRGPGGKGPGGEQMRRFFDCLRDLDLDESQREDLRAAMREHRQQMDEQHDAIRDAAKAYLALLAQPEPDSAELAAAEARIKTLVAESVDARFAHARRIRDILTDEQAAQLNSCVAAEDEAGE